MIAAALALIDEDGADAVTVRGVAKVLGVTPMALYNHFSSKRALLLAVAEHVLGAANFDGRHTRWREQIRHCFDVLRRLCLDHPGLPRLLEIEGAAPAGVFAPMEVSLRALQKAGLDDLASLQTYFVLLSFTLAQGAYQTRGPFPDLEPRGKAAPRRWDFDAMFAFGITLILNGVKATVSRRAGTPPSRSR